MRIKQYLVLFYILFWVVRIFFWVVRLNGCVSLMLLLLLTVSVVSLSCASRDGQAVLARMADSVPVFIAAVVGTSCFRE